MRDGFQALANLLDRARLGSISLPGFVIRGFCEDAGVNRSLLQIIPKLDEEWDLQNRLSGPLAVVVCHCAPRSLRSSARPTLCACAF